MASPDNRDIKLREKIDRTKLAYIIEHASTFDIGKSYSNGKLIGGDPQITLLTDYYRRIENDGCVPTSYVQRNGFGRYWTSTRFGLQNMSRQIRSTIAQDTLLDIDFDNCHPSILLHYCQENDIPCEAVRHYVDNRKEHLTALMDARGCSRDEAKVAYLEVTNGKIVRNLFEASDGFVAYYQNMREILVAIVELRPDLVKISTDNKIKYGKTLYNIEGSVVNLVMTTQENNCLMVMYDLMVKRGLVVASLVFDGLMIEKDDSIDVPRLLKECEEAVMKATGVPLKVSQKEMTFSFDMELDGYIPKLPYQTAPHTAVDKLFEIRESPYVHEVLVTGQRYVGKLAFADGVKTLAIRSSLGSGKTTAICQYIEDNGVERVLILSPRQTFARAITSEYNMKVPSGDRFFCYLNDRAGVTTHDRLTISMESLHLIQDCPPYDLIVVDECQANLVAHTCAGTNGANLDVNVSTFIDLLQRSKQNIFCDAFLNNKTLNFLHNNQLRVELVLFDTPMVQRSAIEIIGKSLDALLIPIDESLARGERSYCFCSSRVRAVRWHAAMVARYPDKTFLLYTRDNKADVSTVNETWGVADLIITTCTITVGINFDKPGWFHNVFVSASAKTSNLVSDIFQSHYRVRHLINNKLYFHIAAAVNKVLPTNYKVIEAESVWKENELLSNSAAFQSAPLAIKQLALDNEFEQNVSVSCLRPCFYRYLEACNYTIATNMTVSGLDQEGGDDAFDFKVEGIDLQFDAIDDLTTLEAHDIRIKRNSGLVQLTADEKVQLDKYIFIQCFATQGFLCIDPAHISKLWNVWIDYGRSKILAIRHEKQILNGSITLDSLFNAQAGKCSLAALQHTRNVKLRWILDICTLLGLRNSQDTDTIIPKHALDGCIKKIQADLGSVRNVFGLRDRRKDKTTDLTHRDYLSLLNSIIKSHGFTKLNITGPDRVRVNKKVVPNPNMKYALFPDGNLDTIPNLPMTCDLVFKHVGDSSGEHTEATECF